MSVRLGAAAAGIRSRIPSAAALAYRLGELPVDFRRRGIELGFVPENNELTVRIEGEAYSIRWGSSLREWPSLAPENGRKAIALIPRNRREFVLVRSDSSVRTIEELAGARIGIPSEGPPSFPEAETEATRGFEEALRLAGLKEADVRRVSLPLEPTPTADTDGFRELSRRLSQALLSGEADAVHAGGALAVGLREVIGARPIASWVASSPLVVTASEQLVRRHPATVERILAHVLAAADWARNNREAAWRLLAKDAGLTESALESAYGEHIHEELEPTLSPDLVEMVDREIERWAACGFLDAEALPIAELLVPDPLEAARELLASGNVERPSSEGVSPYALAPVPDRFFTERREARRIASDEEAIEAAREFAERIREGASERDRERRHPFEELKRLGESGLLGLCVPKAYGGPGVSVRTLTEIFKIVSAADGAIGQIPQNHHFFVRSLELAGTEEQKRFFFGEALRGAQFGNALAERGIKGFKDMTTRLTKAGDGSFRLSGSKYYTTGALYSHWIPVTALDEEERRVTVFVPRDAEGVAVIDDWSGIGQRTTASGSAVFRDVAVPAERVVAHWRIFEKPQTFGAFGQILHAAIDVGIAKAALEDAAWFVREKTRPPFKSGYALASEDPDLIRRFGELGIRLQAAEALLDRAAAAIDDAESRLDETTAGQATLAVDAAKYFAAETSIEMTNALFEVSGTSSMDRKYNYDRHWRNARIHTLHDPARLKLHRVGNWYLNGIYPEYKI